MNSYRETSQKALLLMDFQNFILNNFIPPEHVNEVVKNAKDILHAARKTDLSIIHVTVSFREGYPEVNKNNKLFSSLKENQLGISGTEASKIHQLLKPKINEPIITKHRFSAFHGTDLDMILKAKGIKTLILAGVTTSGVVLSTFRQAFDLDYNITVIKDACADTSSKINDLLGNNLFPELAEVISAEEFIHQLAK